MMRQLIANTRKNVLPVLYGLYYYFLIWVIDIFIFPEVPFNYMKCRLNVVVVCLLTDTKYEHVKISSQAVIFDVFPEFYIEIFWFNHFKSILNLSFD